MQYELYDWQKEAIGALSTDGGRVLVVAPTGGGKSMCYQQPAVDLPGVAVVITPLVALMADQVASLTARGIPATYLASNIDPAEVRRREEMALRGEVKLLYVAPERLASERFVEEVLERLPISLLAIDEAHCISQWGHDFRPEYLQIGEFVQRLRPARLIACTATATPAVRTEILERLHMPGAHQVLRGFARHNLRLSVEEVSGPRAKEKRIAAEVKRVLGKPNAGNGTALVYTGSRKNAEGVAEALRGLGWRAQHYHAGMGGGERTAVQELFQAGRLDVVCATNAFGMGIDRSDIRLVVHHTLPESLEAYYQEVGRAGRDREPAAGLLMISDPDIALRFRLIANDVMSSSPEQLLRRRELLRAMIAYAETSACRHDSILEYFEDEAEELGGCSQCDNCVAAAEGRLLPEPDEGASAEPVRSALAAIRGLPFAAGAGAIASYLIGFGSTQVRKYDWQARRDFGVLRGRSEDWARRLLRRFVAAGLIAIDPEHQTLHITRRAADVVAATRPNPVRLPPERASMRSDSGVSASSLDSAGASLVERLKAWRRLRADGDGVPAYVICHDATLVAIASARPASGEELLRVPGMGGAKVQRYGVQILAEVRAHLTEHPNDAVVTDAPADGAAVPEHLRQAEDSDHRAEVRQAHPRAGERWTPEEEDTVAASYRAGSTPEQIAVEVQRQPGAVASRLVKLGLMEPPAPIERPGDAGLLYERLRVWRRERADSDGTKLWLIAANTVLDAIVARPPSSLAELGAIEGMDADKVARYGDDLLRVLGEHASAEQQAAVPAR